LDLTSEHESLSGEEVEHDSDGLSTLVVSWDGNINVGKRRIGVAESNAWDVHVGGLIDGLMITSWITDDNESWLLELLGVLIGKGTWSPLSSKVVSLGVGGELEDSSLSILSVGDNKDILWVVDGSYHSSGKHHLLPGSGNVQEMNTVLVSSVDVWLHLLGAVLGSNVNSGSEHEGKILLFGL